MEISKEELIEYLNKYSIKNSFLNLEYDEDNDEDEKYIECKYISIDDIIEFINNGIKTNINTKRLHNHIQDLQRFRSYYA